MINNFKEVLADESVIRRYNAALCGLISVNSVLQKCVGWHYLNLLSQTI